MTETATTSGPVGPTPIEADAARTFSHLFAASETAVDPHPAAAIRHFKVQPSLDGLPHDILLQVGSSETLSAYRVTLGLTALLLSLPDLDLDR